MRVAIITESFPPDVNGVAHCVLRVAELLAEYGHHPLVIAPQPPREGRGDSFPFPVVRVPAVPLPGYPSFRLGLPNRRVREALVKHRTEVVHLASPVCLGAHGAAVAGRLGLPAVAVYQTDLPAYARAYRLGRAGEAFAWRWLRGIHNSAARTLAPSTVTATGLHGQGIGNVWLWGRGVDTKRFDPARRSQELRTALVPGRPDTARCSPATWDAWPQRNASSGWPGSPRWTECAWSSSGPARPRPCFASTYRTPSSSASAAVMSWRRSTPASTCSRTADPTRRSGRRCRRPPRAGCRWWLQPPAARWTWSRTG